MARKLRNRMVNNELRFTFNTASGEDFPIRLYMLKYASRLVGNVELTNDFLEWVFMLMSAGDRKDVINHIYGLVKGNDPTRASKRGYRYKSKKEVYEELYNESNLASTINGLVEDEDLNLSRRDFKKYLTGILNGIHAKETERTDESYLKRIHELCGIFDLDDDEKELLCFLYCIYGINSNKMNSLVNEFSYADFLRFASIAVDVPLMNARKKLGKSGRMYQNGFFKEISSQRNDFYDIQDTIIDYICGISRKTIADRYVKGDASKALEISNFNIPVQDMDIIVTLLRSEKPCNILLYGAAGTGKTEFARSVIRSAGLEPRFLQYGEDDDYFNKRRDNETDRMMALKVGVNTIDTSKCVLVVDEADFLLNSWYMFYNVQDAPEKGWLNDFLEKTRAKILWITNETGHMEESTQRRFDYSLRFKEFTMAERQKVFNNLLKGNPLRKQIGSDTIEKLCEEYHVNAGGIASSLDSVGTFFTQVTPDKESVEKVLRGFLAKHEELIHGREHIDRDKLSKIAEQYDHSILHTDTDMGNIEKSLASFTARIDEPGNEERIQMNLLFWGIPGTGKTEYAKYLSKTMKKKLLVKRYSDLESMYVGEAEKNIAAAFREAESTGSILFIDEADSFFTCRENAHASWEVSRTNEFLTQIENHRGILICCTNLLPNMDKAAMRRFNWKIEFKPLRPADRFTLFEKYFNPKGKALSMEMQNRVCGIDGLTPGDLRTVWNRNRFLDEGEIDLEAIEGELEREVRYRKDEKKRVGF